MSEMDKALEELQKSLSGSEFFKAEKSDDEPTDEDFEKKMKKLAKDQPNLFKKFAKHTEPDGDEDEPDGDEAFMKKMKKFLKSEESDGDESGKEYDEKYMKKHFKKFMSSETGRKFMKDETGNSELKKALDSVFEDTLSNPDFDQATAVMVEGTDFFKATKDYMDSTNRMLNNLVNVVSDLADRISTTEKISVNSGVLLSKAFSGIAKKDDSIVPVKGARTFTSENTGNDILSKAQILDYKKVTDALFKAATDEKNPSHRAATALSQYEMAKGDVRRIPVESLKFISELTI